MAGESILIVDDKADARAWLIDHVLRPAGYLVHEAATLADARARLVGSPPQLVILDAHLNGDDGLTLLPEATALAPVIVTTDQPSVEGMSAALAAGARDVLVYPLSPERLARSIKTQLRTAAMLRERSQLREQVERQIQEFNALYTVGKKASALLDIEESLSLVVSAAVNLTGAEEGALMLRDPDSGELFLRAHYNLSDATIQHLRVRVNDALMNRVVQSGRPIMLSGSELIRSHTALPVKAILSVPLFAGDRVTGVLSVDNRLNVHPFTEHDVHLLSTLADSAAIAIENAHLYWQADSERAKLDTIVREIADVVIVTDAETRILLINKAARAAFNLDDRAIGRPIAEAIPNQAIVDLFDQRKLRSHNWRAEVVLPDGRTLQGQLSILSGIGYGAVLQDISRLKELDRIKNEFVSIVSHDLRTPLTTIRGYVSLLPRVGPLNEQQQEFVQRVERSMSVARRMHAEADYSRMWLALYEDIVRRGEMGGEDEERTSPEGLVGFMSRLGIQCAGQEDDADAQAGDEDEPSCREASVLAEDCVEPIAEVEPLGDHVDQEHVDKAQPAPEVEARVAGGRLGGKGHIRINVARAWLLRLG